MLGIFLDSEANGLDPFVHKMIEIAFKFVNLSTGKEVESYQTIIFQNKAIWKKSDPKSLEVNGFTYDMILSGKKEDEVRKEIIDLFFKHKISRKNAVFLCHNPFLDRIYFSKLISANEQEKMLWPYYWLDFASMYFALELNKMRSFQSFAGFSKDNIAKRLHLPPEETPHKAINGVDHLILCYKNLIGFPKEQTATFF